ncbi:MAG: DNA mismatch repair protein MutL, partial [Polyangiales bacterium]
LSREHLDGAWSGFALEHVVADENEPRTRSFGFEGQSDERGFRLNLGLDDDVCLAVRLILGLNIRNRCPNIGNLAAVRWRRDRCRHRGILGLRACSQPEDDRRGSGHGEHGSKPQANARPRRRRGRLARDAAGTWRSGSGFDRIAVADERRLADSTKPCVVEGLGERVHVRVAFGGVLRETLEDDKFEFLAALDVCVGVSQRRCRLKHVLGEHTHERVTDERNTSRHQLVHDDAHRINIDAVIEALPGGLFRRHVLRRAEDHSGLRQLSAWRTRCFDIAHLGDAEVHDLCEVGPLFALCEKDILRLHVAVNDALGMGRRQSTRALARDIKDPLDAQRSVTGDEIREVLAFEEFHDEVALTRRSTAEVRDIHDILVTDTRCALRLLAEALHHFGARREIIAKHLDGDAFLDGHVEAFIHKPHAAFADAPDDSIAIEFGAHERVIDERRIKANLRWSDEPRRVDGAKDLSTEILGFANRTDFLHPRGAEATKRVFEGQSMACDRGRVFFNKVGILCVCGVATSSGLWYAGPMSHRVRLLGDALIDQIAAGEVIERPASVVKELLDNAIDAGATTVRVELKDGGRERVLVQDDGEGMDREDAAMCVVRHATSKLATLDDLDAIATLGFRGEALASIASVSRFRLLTRQRDEIEGTEVRIEGGGGLNVAPIGCAPGTTVDVQELFFNVPARKKFLSARQTEMRHVAKECLHAALANPGLRLTLIHDGRKLREFLPVRTRAERVQRAFSDLAVRTAKGEHQGIRVEAIVAPPSHATKGARKLHLIVNGRAVVDRRLAYAAAFAFGDELPSGHYPVGVIYIDLAPEDVDVNAHPQKTEVRFRSPRLLSDAVTNIVGRARVTPSPRAPQSPQTELPRAPSFWAERLGGVGHAAQTPHSYSAPQASAANALADALRGTDSDQPEKAALPAGERPKLVGRLSGGEWLVEFAGCLHVIVPRRVDALAAKRALSEGETASLLFPTRLELDAKTLARLEGSQAALEQLGFRWSALGGNTYMVDAVPACLHGADGAVLLRAFLDGGQKEMLRFAPAGSDEERLASLEDEAVRRQAAIHRVDLRTLRGIQ